MLSCATKARATIRLWPTDATGWYSNCSTGGLAWATRLTRRRPRKAGIDCLTREEPSSSPNGLSGERLGRAGYRLERLRYTNVHLTLAGYELLGGLNDDLAARLS